MKILQSLLLILVSVNAYSQDTIRINQIDLLVANINQSNLPVQSDTLIQDLPEFGLKTITYLTTILHENQLKKYVNFVTSITTVNGISSKMIASNTFYFCENKLIKVEEFITNGDNKMEFDWYYDEQKPLYHTLQSDKAKARASLLLSMSNSIIKEVVK